MPKNINDMDMLIFICLCLWSLNGVFVADAVKSESVTEGESVSLNSSLTQIQTHEDIEWKFAELLIAKVKKNKESKFYNTTAAGRFKDRLKLDHQTGSLTIINSRTTDSGLYTVSSSRTDTTINTINLTVYAHLPVPVISRDCLSSSSSSSCSLVCSAVNVGHVTLSWFKGNSSLPSISVSDLSISLSLPLEVEYQDRNTYSCVLNNPIRNQTRHLNITELCHTCAAGESSLIIGLISAAAGSLLIVAAVGIFWICRKKTHQEVQSGEEITYADPTFYKRRAQKSRAQEEEDVVYAGVVMRH
ncbi:carcinoembryonic antigen-related cell adhesion molecule 1-like isoform X9 [Ctenopharyngodon idella]|uniref:carcinoembryonic antigen-related cell adhesion molecule 1-like isoform X9 n=1 Tax=Ctenopharyngodon idella TaxID=7959 RepID=UPI002230E8D7|nr:carcinoembryonic antigen-related cell adhesion molecule 1-like isoform X9 [Ctenopharyngodon idella]